MAASLRSLSWAEEEDDEPAWSTSPLQGEDALACMPPAAQVPSALFGDGSILPDKVLFPLLHALRAAYAHSTLQSKLQEARARATGLKRSPLMREMSAMLAEVQAPIFRRFGVAPPPTGVFVLMRTMEVQPFGSEAHKVGSQCRVLLGQQEGSMSEEDGMAAAAYAASYTEAEASPWTWEPAPPPPEAPSVEVAESAYGGEGIFARRAFAAGETILMEEALAWFDCENSAAERTGGVCSMYQVLGFLRSGLLPAVLHSSLCRGPDEGSKARQCADLVQLAIENLAEPWEWEAADALVEALRVFGFNAYFSCNNRSQILYALICKANHSCAPNATVHPSESGPGSLLCTHPVQEGDEITVSYLTERDLHKPCKQRQAVLHRGWEFTCMCSRCSTEATCESEPRFNDSY